MYLVTRYDAENDTYHNVETVASEVVALMAMMVETIRTKCPTLLTDDRGVILLYCDWVAERDGVRLTTPNETEVFG